MSRSSEDQRAQDHKAEIIDGIYDVAVEPARFEALVDLWEERLGPVRRRGVRDFADAEIEQHAARAWLFLDRLEAASARTGLQAILTGYGRTAAFATVDGVSVIGANPAAKELFGLGQGRRLDTLPIDPADVNALARIVRKTLQATQKLPAVLRARSLRTGGPIVFRVAPIDHEGALAALVLTSEFAWPEPLTDMMREAFNLTLAEVEIVRGLVAGLAMKDIAASRGRSQDTVRTQIKSILAKTETHSQSELVRITLGLMEVHGGPSASERPEADNDAELVPIPYSSIRQPDGRRYDYIEFGDPKGRPVIYFSLDYGLIRWPASAEAAAARRGIRVISPIRAGYGHSDPLPQKVTNYGQETGRDALELMKRLGIERAAIMAIGADLRYAIHMALLEPQAVSGILGCAPMLPVQTADQYERMGKWHRFILANGRYAPRILPFLVKAGYSMARRLGKDRFFRAVNAGSPSDLATFEIPEVRKAILVGSDVCLSDWHSSHEAFAREVIDSENNWCGLIDECTAPIKLLQGDEDPQNPIETTRELEHRFPKVEIEYFQGAGQLLFFQEWPRALNDLEKLLPAAPSARGFTSK